MIRAVHNNDNQPEKPISLNVNRLSDFISMLTEETNDDINDDNDDSLQSLSLATAALLFMLSRDRQIEIDKPTLQLLLKLLDPLEKNNNNQDSKKTGTSYYQVSYLRRSCF